MLIRTSIDGPLFYKFIFNLSFDPRLVCPPGFILSPLGSEVMISCHVAFFRVICYNPVLQSRIQGLPAARIMVTRTTTVASLAR